MNISLQEVDSLKIDDYLRKSFTCECGKSHGVDIDNIIVENGAVSKLPEILNSYRYKNVFLVANNNTYEAAGKQAEEVLKEAAFEYKKLIYTRQHDLVPDEAAVGEFLINI